MDATGSIASVDESKKRPTRQDLKDYQVAQKNAEAVIDTTKVFFRALIENPNIWNNADVDEIKAAIYEVTNQPSKYPPPDFATVSSLDSDSAELTKGVVQKLETRDIRSLPSITIQVVQASQTNKGVTVQNRNCDIRLWKFTGVDGDGRTFHLRVDSTLNSKAIFLEPGCILKVDDFFDVYFRVGADVGTRCAIVMRSFNIVAFKSVGNMPPEPMPFREDSGDSSPTSIDPMNWKECDGQLCSTHGVKFLRCIRHCRPVSEVRLQPLARDCVFSRSEIVEELQMKEKRFLLYYYYATTVYQFHGAKNRVMLPSCLVNAIRNEYPEKDPSDYATEGY